MPCPDLAVAFQMVYMRSWWAGIIRRVPLVLMMILTEVLPASWATRAAPPPYSFAGAHRKRGWQRIVMQAPIILGIRPEPTAGTTAAMPRRRRAV